MTPQEQQRLDNIERMLLILVASDRYTFQKHLQIFDGKNIQVGKTTGTKIGTESTQKLSFYGATPIVRQAAITAPTGGATIDTQARTAINDLQTRLTNLGLTA